MLQRTCDQQGPQRGLPSQRQTQARRAQRARGGSAGAWHWSLQHPTPSSSPLSAPSSPPPAPPPLLLSTSLAFKPEDRTSQDQEREQGFRGRPHAWDSFVSIDASWTAAQVNGHARAAERAGPSPFLTLPTTRLSPCVWVLAPGGSLSPPRPRPGIALGCAKVGRPPSPQTPWPAALGWKERPPSGAELLELREDRRAACRPEGRTRGGLEAAVTGSPEPRAFLRSVPWVTGTGLTPPLRCLDMQLGDRAHSGSVPQFLHW